MPQEFSLGEFLAQAQRSMGGGMFGRIQGPLSGYLFGPDFFRKATYLAISDTFTATYGKKVWDALNNRTVFWNAIKKVDWGPTVGWRLRSARFQTATSSGPVTESGDLPTIDVSQYRAVFSYPRTVATTFGVSLQAQAVSGLEGGIGNQLAVEQEAKMRDHIKEIQQELLLSGSTIVSTGGASTTGAVAQGEYLRVGDTFGESTAGDDAQTITAISAAGVLTFTGGYTLTDGAIVYVKSRGGFSSLDDIIEEDGRTIAGVTVTNGPDVYNQATRTANGYAAGAVILDNNGTARDISISLVDQAIRESRINGGEPKLMLTGFDQYDKFAQLLQPQQRFVDFADYVVGVGDERTYPGTQVGMQLATYKGIPILPDPDCAKGVNASDADLGCHFYVLDTDYLEIAVMYPTQYIENRDYFAAGKLVQRGLFFTMAELRSLRMDVHSKITDLNA